MRLVKERAGRYRTDDGRFTIAWHHMTSFGSEYWQVHARDAGDRAVEGLHLSLAEARAAVDAHGGDTTGSEET